MTTHDYTRRYWGHDFNCEPAGRDNDIKGFIYGEPLHVGDYLILPNEDKTTRYQITDCKRFYTPGDQYRFTAKFAPRTEPNV